jgi:hypothetical protein
VDVHFAPDKPFDPQRVNTSTGRANIGADTFHLLGDPYASDETGGDSRLSEMPRSLSQAGLSLQGLVKVTLVVIYKAPC